MNRSGVLSVGLLLLLGHVPALAQSTAAGSAVPVKTTSFEEMRYPLSARLRGVKGAVVVRLVIDPAGEVQAAEALSGDPALAGEAAKNARRWKFEPGSGTRSRILLYLFQIEGLCKLPCASQFLYRPPDMVTVTMGEPVVELAHPNR